MTSRLQELRLGFTRLELISACELIRSHVFRCKRIELVSLVVFLDLNVHRPDAPEEDRVRAVLGLAAREMT